MKFSKDDRIATITTFGLNAAILLFSLWYTIDLSQNFRPSFIEVELGEYQTGQDAEFSKEQNEQVAQRPNPSEQEVEDPQEDAPDQEEQPESTLEEETKPVDAPDQVEEVEEDPIQTPETEVVNPNAKIEEIQEEEVVIPPKAVEADKSQEGETESGDLKGDEGDVNSDEGTGDDEDKSAPFQLEWEGDLERGRLQQPLPENTTNREATITMRFEVRPNGTVGRIIPIRKMDPDLETEVMNMLKAWKFTRLPSGAPQTNQWGRITFRFLVN